MSCVAAHYYKFGSISPEIVMITIFHTFYVWDALNSEAAILTTMDITTDGFGFMLSFGDLAWVPFTYSMQVRYLADRQLNWAPWQLAAILVLNLIGFWIFRGANGQKNDFRTNPQAANVNHLQYLTTETGSKLIISGWWGMARHINYLGDWIMGLTWCLPCGFSHPLPYYYAIYFAILLIHRERRDEEKCAAKYKQDWVKYCRLVPWRIIPYIY